MDVEEWNQSSKGKKLPMKVQESHSEIRSLAKKAAEIAYERNPKKQQRDKPEDKPEVEEKSPAHKIVDSDSGMGFLGDALFPFSWGGERAGRTQAMADAIGEQTTFNVRHPGTHSMLSSMLGGLAGGGLGLAATNLLPSGDLKQHAPYAGVLGGSLLGAGLSGLGRNLEMDRINHFYNEDLAAGKVEPKAPNLSTLAAILMPFRGAHRTGQMEAYNAMKGTPIEDQRPMGRDVLNTARGVADVVGSAAGMTSRLGMLSSGVPGLSLASTGLGALQGYGQNIKTQLASNKARKQEKKDVASLAKAAAQGMA
ncbi:MAG: hypothetical protein EHM87_20110 [Burkholderiales bacterium]|nr:MAG: hypothetical protein EHM87_20110 [Burkholderiales bacterium]